MRTQWFIIPVGQGSSAEVRRLTGLMEARILFDDYGDHDFLTVSDADAFLRAIMKEGGEKAFLTNKDRIIREMRARGVKENWAAVNSTLCSFQAKRRRPKIACLNIPCIGTGILDFQYCRCCNYPLLHGYIVLRKSGFPDIDVRTDCFDSLERLYLDFVLAPPEGVDTKAAIRLYQKAAKVVQPMNLQMFQSAQAYSLLSKEGRAKHHNFVNYKKRAIWCRIQQGEWRNQALRKRDNLRVDTQILDNNGFNNEEFDIPRGYRICGASMEQAQRESKVMQFARK